MHRSASQVNSLMSKSVNPETDSKVFVVPKRADVLARYLPFLCVTATSALILSVALFLESTLSLGAFDHRHYQPSQDQLLVAAHQVSS